MGGMINLRRIKLPALVVCLRFNLKNENKHSNNNLLSSLISIKRQVLCWICSIAHYFPFSAQFVDNSYSIYTFESCRILSQSKLKEVMLIIIKLGGIVNLLRNTLTNKEVIN